MSCSADDSVQVGERIELVEPGRDGILEIFKDVNGCWSSKRVMAFAVAAVFLPGCVLVILRSPAAAAEVLWIMATLIAGCLGLGVLERRGSGIGGTPNRDENDHGPLPSRHGSAGGYRR